MTVALARRLVWDGVITQDDVSRALHTHVTRRVAFLEALLLDRPALAERVESELGGRGLAGDGAVVVDPALFALLPRGLCGLLLAVPVGKDERTGAVRLVAADPSDPHVATEFGHHFGTSLEVKQGALRTILSAANAAEGRGAPSARPSDAPIPLVRISAEATSTPRTLKGVAPQAVGTSPAPRIPVVVPPRAGAPLAEPVIQLTRAKSLAPPSQAPAGKKSTLPGAPAPPSAGGVRAAEPDRAGEDMDAAKTPEEVAAALARGMGSVARRVIVLALRGKVFEGREASDETTRRGARKLVISTERPSVLLTAAQTGQYVGPLPQTLVHQELSDLLGGPMDDVVVGSVTVSGRAALVYVAVGLDTTYLATRRGEKLAQAAGKAIERIVRGRKK